MSDYRTPASMALASAPAGDMRALLEAVTEQEPATRPAAVGLALSE